MLIRSLITTRMCLMCRAINTPRRGYSQHLEESYSDQQKAKILQVINDTDSTILSRYNVTKSRMKHILQYKSNNGNLKCLSDIDMVQGFSDKFAKILFDSILEGPTVEKKDEKANPKIRGQVLQPLLSEHVRKKCKTVATVYISVNSVCWTMINRVDYELLQWEYFGIDYAEGKRLQITDILDIAWKVTTAIPQADVYVMKAEATTLRAAGSDPNNPKVLAVNLQKAQMVAMMVALINARSHTNDTAEGNKTSEDVETLQQKVYFLRSSLPYRLYGTLVGNEKVSTDQTIEMILQNIKEKSKDNSQLYISEGLKQMFRNQKELEKDMLGHCLLLAMTFMDICIYKRRDSIEKLVSRRKD